MPKNRTSPHVEKTNQMTEDIVSVRTVYTYWRNINIGHHMEITWYPNLCYKDYKLQLDVRTKDYKLQSDVRTKDYKLQSDVRTKDYKYSPIRRTH